MKIGILGSGQVGQTLAKGFAKYNYEVMIASRDPVKLEAFAKENPNIKLGAFAETANFGEMLVLCVKGDAAEKVLRGIGEQSLNGKVIIDTTNPIAAVPPDNGVLHYFTTLESSLMERLQEQVPGAKFVKAFNSAGNPHMVNPDFGGTKPTMFICGNDAEAKKKVAQILDQFGWETQDCGGAYGARAIEPLCMLWCIPGFLENQWNTAFKLLKK